MEKVQKCACEQRERDKVMAQQNDNGEDVSEERPRRSPGKPRRGWTG